MIDATQMELAKKDLLQALNISRQAQHKNSKRLKEIQAKEQFVLDLIHAIRHRHPRMGTRKLLYEISPTLRQNGISIARDQLFDLLRRENMLISPKKRQTRTTRSGLWRCPNLLKDTHVSAICQAWVGDITYLTLEVGFAYLVLLTDAFSRYIVGYNLSSSLIAEGAESALKMGIQANKKMSLSGCIHHTDHGVQYTSNLVQNLLKKHHMKPSMGEVGNCYENALAERMNGILKQEYALDALFVNVTDAQTSVEQAVYLYNFERPHTALGFRKPAEVHFDGK